jgi:hypothetical protein
MKPIKYITIEEAAKEDSGALWVQNETSSVEEYAPQGGDLIFNVRDADGAQNLVTIPLTWIPIDISLDASKAILLKSSDMRKAWSRGLIKIISAESALSVLESTDAIREVERLEAKRRAISMAVSSKGITGAEVTVVGDTGLESENTVKTSEILVGNMDEDGEEFQELVSASFKAWVNSCNAVSEDEAIGKIKIRRTLGEHEVRYLAEHSIHGRIGKWAKSKIKELAGK